MKTILFLTFGLLFGFSEAVYDFVFASRSIDLTGQLKMGAITYVVGYSAELIVSLLLAGFIDRFHKKTAIIVTTSLTLFAYAASSLMCVILPASLPALWASAFIMDFSHHLLKSSLFASMAFAFEINELPKIHGAEASLHGVLKILGPALGGLVYSVFGSQWSMSIAFALFALAAPVCVLYANSCRNNRKEPQRETLPIVATFHAAQELLATTGWIAIMALEICLVLVAGVTSLSTFGILKIDKGFIDSQAISIVLGVQALGSVAAGFTLKRLAKVQRSNFTPVFSLLLMAVSLVGILVSRDVLGVGISLACLSFGFTLHARWMGILLQTSFPPERLASYDAVFGTLNIVIGAVGILISGIAFDYIGLEAIVFLGITVLAFSLPLAIKCQKTTAANELKLSKTTEGLSI